VIRLSRPALVNQESPDPDEKCSCDSAVHWKQIRERRFIVAAIGQGRASTKEQHPAAAPIHELLNQFLLRRRKDKWLLRSKD